jgi:hypothetical protein
MLWWVCSWSRSSRFPRQAADRERGSRHNPPVEEVICLEMETLEPRGSLGASAPWENPTPPSRHLTSNKNKRASRRPTGWNRTDSVVPCVVHVRCGDTTRQGGGAWDYPVPATPGNLLLLLHYPLLPGLTSSLFSHTPRLVLSCRCQIFESCTATSLRSLVHRHRSSQRAGRH